MNSMPRTVPLPASRGHCLQDSKQLFMSLFALYKHIVLMPLNEVWIFCAVLLSCDFLLRGFCFFLITILVLLAQLFFGLFVLMINANTLLDHCLISALKCRLCCVKLCRLSLDFLPRLICCFLFTCTNSLTHHFVAVSWTKLHQITIGSSWAHLMNFTWTNKVLDCLYDGTRKLTKGKLRWEVNKGLLKHANEELC